MTQGPVMPEWPEGIPNPHARVGHDHYDKADDWMHAEHHRAQEDLLAYIEGQNQVIAAQAGEIAVKDSNADAVQALLAVRDAAHGALLSLGWAQQYVPMGDDPSSATRRDYETLRKALQGLPEHLKGQV